jgi:hypothetical protein
MATSVVQVPSVTEPMPFTITATIHDASGESVAEATVQWLLGPVPVK